MEKKTRKQLEAGKCYLGRTQTKVFFFKVIESAVYNKADLGGEYVAKDETINIVEVRADGVPDICEYAVFENFLSSNFLTDAMFDEIEEEEFNKIWNQIVEWKLTIQALYETYSDDNNVHGFDVVKSYKNLPF